MTHTSALRSALLFLALFAAASLLCLAEVPARFPIEIEQVVAAMQAANLPVTQVEVTMIPLITSNTAGAVLQVQAVSPWGDRRAHVRLVCQSQQCLPFYASVAWSTPELARAALDLSRTRAPAPGPAEAPAGQTLPAAAGPSTTDRSSASSPAMAQRVPASQPTLRAGAHAILVLDGERLHLRVAVICLQSGGPGNTIRVTAVDHKQVYVAEVVDSTMLKGTLLEGFCLNSRRTLSYARQEP